MDDITGSTVTDLGSSGDDGTLQADAAQTDGVIGKAVTFDGTGDYIDLGNYTATDGLQNLSVSLWFKTDEIPASELRPILGIGPSGSRIPWIFFPNGASAVRVQMSITAPGVDQVDTPTLAQDTWYHLVFTHDAVGAGNAILYLNGVSVDSDTAIDSTSGASGNAGDIGTFLTSYFKGDIDDVRIYSRTLSPAEALELYELGALDAMTSFDAAYFKEYIASRSGFFGNNLWVGNDLIVVGDGIFDEITLTSPSANDIKIAAYPFGDNSGIVFESQTSGVQSWLNMMTKDGDGTDNLQFRMFAKGTTASITDSEYFRIFYNTTGPKFQIESLNSGDGTVRPLHISTGTNTNQVILNIDGSVAFDEGNVSITAGVFEVEGTTDPIVIFDQNTTAAAFTDYQGTAGTGDSTISTTGMGASSAGTDVAAPDAASWSCDAMIKVQVNGVDHWIPAY
ncbi:hypothetical protein LCGC14_2651460, partial [marine sediment metagenome]